MKAKPTQLNEYRFADLLEAAPDAMLLVNADGVITLVNSQTRSLFGFSQEELIGQKVELLIPEALRAQHVKLRQAYLESPKLRVMNAGLELFGQHKDGSQIPLEISLNPLMTPEGLVVLSAIRDISERRHIEAKLRASLREKEVLLKEVHHRVKNNLQVISSLLSFQSDLIEDAKTRGMFDDARARIKSIALIHERLYQSEDLSHIDLTDYVKGLIDDLFDSYAVSRQRIQVNIDIAGVTLDMDTLVNCGLIISELVSNALKYAFPDKRPGRLAISLKQRNSAKLTLEVADDGIGIPLGKSFERPTLGLRLVRGLAKELGGSLEMQHDKGTKFIITFSTHGK